MTEQQAALAGSTEPAAIAPRAATSEGQQAQDTPRAKAAPRTRGFVAAFGSGSGAAWVFRDLASI